MITLTPTEITLPKEPTTIQRTFWYQNQYAIANRHGSPQEYKRGRIVRKLGDDFYIKSFGQADSVAVHKTNVEFFSEDGKTRLTEEQIKQRLKNGEQL